MVIDNVFCPDKEFEDFVQYFVDNFKELELGRHYSSNKKYSLDLLAEFDEPHGGNNNVASVDIYDKIFELNKGYITNEASRLLDSKEALLFWIVWIYTGYEVIDFVETDTIAMNYLIKKGVSKNKLFEIFSYQLKCKDSAQNFERLENIKTLSTNNN